MAFLSDMRKLLIASKSIWTAPTLVNSWANYGSGFNPAGYFKDVNGVVHLRGLLKDGVVGTTSAMFTLPTGFRPATRCLFNIQSNSALGRCDILATGEVYAYAGNNAWFCLDGITFLAEQ